VSIDRNKENFFVYLKTHEKGPVPFLHHRMIIAFLCVQVTRTAKSMNFAPIFICRLMASAFQDATKIAMYVVIVNTMKEFINMIETESTPFFASISHSNPQCPSLFPECLQLDDVDGNAVNVCIYDP